MVPVIESKNTSRHWDNIYEKKPMETLGWYEESPRPSLELIENCNLPNDATIFHTGIGISQLPDILLLKGYTNMILNDISATALETLRQRLPDTPDISLQFICEDLTRPEQLLDMDQVDLWHDRAVLHFLTDKKDQKTYFDLLRKKVKSGGFVILAAFNLCGAEKCSGLPVHQYDCSMMQSRLGEGFNLIKTFNFDYYMPSGDLRPYVYALFKRQV